MRPARSLVAAEPPSQRAQHPSEAMQPKQPATFARIPHSAGIEHHGVELLRALHGDPEAEAAEPARPDLLRDRRRDLPGHGPLTRWRGGPAG